MLSFKAVTILCFLASFGVAEVIVNEQLGVVMMGPSNLRDLLQQLQEIQSEETFEYIGQPYKQAVEESYTYLTRLAERARRNSRCDGIDEIVSNFTEQVEERFSALREYDPVSSIEYDYNLQEVFSRAEEFIGKLQSAVEECGDDDPCNADLPAFEFKVMQLLYAKMEGLHNNMLTQARMVASIRMAMEQQLAQQLTNC